MDSNLNTNDYRFPKAVIIILVYATCHRFVSECIRSVLALYLADILKFEESESIVIIHVFMSVVMISSLFGGILSDSWLGQFKSIIYFSILVILALLLLSGSVVTIFHLPRRELSILCIFLIALGYGAIKSSVIAFGGDQFVLPQQKKQISLLFVLISVGYSIASLSNDIITPVFRKDLMCFQELTCYPLVFLFPALLMIISFVMLVLTKRFFIMKKPEGNMALDITKCVFYAVYKKIKSKDKHLYWLDYAGDKYDLKLINDIKSAFHVLKLFLPTSIYWALAILPYSLWTFQASRMDGEFYGYLIKPDQMPAINSLFMIILIPIFHIFIYPMLEKYFFLRTPLRKITTSCVVLVFSFVCSGVLEMNLEPTYAVTPTAGNAQLRIFNTLNCNVSIVIDERKFVLEKLNMWQNICIPTTGKKFLKYKADFHDCEMLSFDPKLTQGELEVEENQATSWVITNEGMNYKFIDNVEKSTTGNPLVRALIYIDKDCTEEQAALTFVHNGDVLRKITVSKKFSETELVDMIHKKYDLYLNEKLVESNCSIRVGGVYTILGHVSNSKVVARVVTVTQPNSVYIFWMLPQQILLAMSAVTINMLMMEFAFSQAPPTMKSFMQSCWFSSGIFGNLTVIIITELKPFKRRLYQHFFYAILMMICTILFGTLAFFYKYTEYPTTRKDEDDELKKDEKSMSRKLRSWESKASVIATLFTRHL